MAFEEGHNLSKGRPKGAQNKAGREVRNKLSTYLTDEGYKDLIKEIRLLEGTDKVNALLKLMKFVIPELKSIDMTAIVSEPSKHRTPEEIRRELAAIEITNEN